MAAIPVTNSFRIRTFDDINCLREYKLKQLKTNTSELVLEKYPLYKQINNVDNTSIKFALIRIRALCNEREEKIKTCEDIQDLTTIPTDKENLRGFYALG